MIVGDVFGHDVDMRTPPISLSVLEPYKNVKLPVSVTEDFCEAATPYGYSCYIHYGTQDENGKMMPDGDLPANENFLRAPIAYQQNNWVPALACGGQTCVSINPAAWNDHILMAGYPGFTPPSNCYATTYSPQPTQPTNGSIPRDGVEVRYWPGEWRLGSATPGMGIRVQKNNWNEFVDHAQYDNIISPAPD